MLPIIEKDITDKDLLSKEQFLEYAALSQTLPGIIAVNCAVFTGRAAAGIKGALAAALGAVLPAFAGMLIAAALMEFIPREGIVVGVFRGIRVCSAALLVLAAYSLLRSVIKNKYYLIISAAVFVALLFLNVNAAVIVLAAIVTGAIIYYIKRGTGR